MRHSVVNGNWISYVNKIPTEEGRGIFCLGAGEGGGGELLGWSCIIPRTGLKPS